jgi:hypothetical protein
LCAQSTSVNVKLQVESSPFVNTDGDFDNGIIAHEYGHGISTRCGRSKIILVVWTIQIRWAKDGPDWYALMMQLLRDVGTTKSVELLFLHKLTMVWVRVISIQQI